MKTTNYSILILILLIFFLSAHAQKDYQLKSEEGKFQIKFPAEYSSKTTENENAITEKANCVVDGQTYMASYTIHKTEMVDHEEMASVSADSFGEAIEGTEILREPWEIKGNKGLYVKFELPTQDAIVEYKVLLIDQIQYQIISLAIKEDYNENLANKFFKSFKLIQ